MDHQRAAFCVQPISRFQIAFVSITVLELPPRRPAPEKNAIIHQLLRLSTVSFRQFMDHCQGRSAKAIDKEPFTSGETT